MIGTTQKYCVGSFIDISFLYAENKKMMPAILWGGERESLAPKKSHFKEV